MTDRPEYDVVSRVLAIVAVEPAPAHAWRDWRALCQTQMVADDFSTIKPPRQAALRAGSNRKEEYEQQGEHCEEPLQP